MSEILIVVKHLHLRLQIHEDGSSTNIIQDLGLDPGSSTRVTKTRIGVRLFTLYSTPPESVYTSPLSNSKELQVSGGKGRKTR